MPRKNTRPAAKKAAAKRKARMGQKAQHRYTGRPNLTEPLEALSTSMAMAAASIHMLGHELNKRDKS